MSDSNVVGYIMKQYMIKTLEVGSKLGKRGLFRRGYFVTTVGHDEETVRNYIKNQDKNEEKKEDDNQGDLFQTDYNKIN